MSLLYLKTRVKLHNTFISIQHYKNHIGRPPPQLSLKIQKLLFESTGANIFSKSSTKKYIHFLNCDGIIKCAKPLLLLLILPESSWEINSCPCHSLVQVWYIFFSVQPQVWLLSLTQLYSRIPEVEQFLKMSIMKWIRPGNTLYEKTFCKLDDRNCTEWHIADCIKVLRWLENWKRYVQNTLTLRINGIFTPYL